MGFSEAVEIALTGDNARWRGRSDIWRKSWRNLHHGQEPQVAVELRLDGDPDPATVLRTWHGDDVADSTAELDRPGHHPVPLPGLGGQEDQATYRPFLSYFTNKPTSSCSNKYDIRSVGTHEAGHVFGLGHVGSGHENLTMYTNSFVCSTKARTLGKGDVLGLRSIY